MFDSFAGEVLAQRLYQDTRAILVDAEGVGLHKVVLHMKANAFVLSPVVLLGLAAILFGLGFVVLTIRVDAPEEALEALLNIPKMIVIGLGLLAVIAALVLVSRSGVLKEVANG